MLKRLWDIQTPGTKFIHFVTLGFAPPATLTILIVWGILPPALGLLSWLQVFGAATSGLVVFTNKDKSLRSAPWVGTIFGTLLWSATTLVAMFW